MEKEQDRWCDGVPELDCVFKITNYEFLNMNDIPTAVINQTRHLCNEEGREIAIETNGTIEVPDII